MAEEVLLQMIGECIKVAQDLPQTPGQFRITNGHARKAELCSKGLELTKSISHRNEHLIKCLQDFRDLMAKVTLADGRCYAMQVSNVCLRFLYSVEEAVINGIATMARAESLDFLPLSTWQIVTKEWDTGMAHLKDAIKELSPSTLTDENNNNDSSVGGGLQEKIVMLLKGVKTVMRKVRTKCLQPLIEPVETAEGIAWLDDILDAVTPLMQATEEVAVAGFPPENPVQVATYASEVVTFAQTLCVVAMAYPGNPPSNRSKSPVINGTTSSSTYGLEEEELAWFENAQIHFDHLLSPILETFPIR